MFKRNPFESCEGNLNSDALACSFFLLWRFPMWNPDAMRRVILLLVLFRVGLCAAAELTLPSMVLVPEIHHELAPNLVSVAKAPAGTAFLMVECRLEVDRGRDSLEL